MGTSTNSILEVDVDLEAKAPALGRVKELLSSHFGTLSGLAMHPSKPLFVTVGRDKSVNLWLSDSFSCASQARLTAPATSVCFCNNGETIAIGLTNFEFVVLEVVEEGNFQYVRASTRAKRAQTNTCFALASLARSRAGTR